MRGSRSCSHTQRALGSLLSLHPWLSLVPFGQVPEGTGLLFRQHLEKGHSASMPERPMPKLSERAWVAYMNWSCSLSSCKGRNHLWPTHNPSVPEVKGATFRPRNECSVSDPKPSTQAPMTSSH